jgi:hypothetical protein
MGCTATGSTVQRQSFGVLVSESACVQRFSPQAKYPGRTPPVSLDESTLTGCRGFAGVAKTLAAEPVAIGHSMGGFLVKKYLEKHSAPAGVLSPPCLQAGRGGLHRAYTPSSSGARGESIEQGENTARPEHATCGAPELLLSRHFGGGRCTLHRSSRGGACRSFGTGQGWRRRWLNTTMPYSQWSASTAVCDRLGQIGAIGVSENRLSPTVFRAGWPGCRSIRRDSGRR